MESVCEVHSTNETDRSLGRQLCHMELLNVVCFGFYAYVTLLILLYLHCSSKRRTSNCSNLFVAHSLRAVISLILLLMHLTELSETLLGSWNVLKVAGPTLSLLAWMLSQLFYAEAESRSQPKYLLLTGIFWMCCGLAKGISVYRLLDLGLGIQHVRPYCTAMVSTLCYALALIDIITVLYEVHLPHQKSSKNSSKVFTSYRHSKSVWYSKVTFYWLVPLLKAGFANPLELEDLGQLPVKETAQKQFAVFNSIYKKQKEQYGLQVSLWKCYTLCYWRKFLLGGLYKLLGDGVGFIPPLGISVVIQYVDAVDSISASNVGIVQIQNHFPTIQEFINNGYVMSAVVLVSALAQGSFSQASTHILNVEGIRLKTALQALVYRKALSLSNCNNDDDSFQESKSGNIMNLIAEDAYNIMTCYWIGHYVWAIPLKICILMYLLYLKLGISAIVGASCCIIILTPLQFIIGKKMSANSKSVTDYSDERLRQTNEVLQGIRLLKLYGWESDFVDRILTVRKKELQLLNLDSLYCALMTFLTQASSVLITLVTLAAFCILEGSSLSPSDVFSGLALINQLTVPLFIFPITVPIIISALVSTKRIENFLSMPETMNVVSSGEEVIGVQTKKTGRQCEVQFKQHGHTDSVFGLENITELEELDDNAEKIPEHHGNTPAIVMKNAAFSWGEKLPTLNVTFLSIPKGKLTMVVGQVGSGKSSLLLAILGEMQCTKGTITWDSGLSIAYVAQKPWLLNGSLRDNVLFGRPYRAHRYKRVIAATALQPDIDILPAKDLTDIGERGINLSGGQRQRIAIARALYSKANIVILDDPLSALDYQVAQQVFVDGIMKIVNKQKQTVIMVTNSLQLLPYSHQVIVMENGNVKTSGCFTEVEKSGINFLGEWQTNDEAYKGRTAKERWQLIRLVSRIGQQLKQRNLNEEVWAADQVVPPLFVPFRKRLGTFSGSRYLAHDLPLPTDECDEEELIERKRRACANVAVQLPRHRSIIRATSLQTGQSHFNPVMRQSSSPSIHNTFRSRIYTRDLASSQNANSGLLHHLFSTITPRTSGSSDQDKNTVQRLSSTTSDCSDDFFEEDESSDTVDWGMSKSTQEEREYGKIKLKVYLTYLSACGMVMGILYIMSILSWQGLRVYTDFWLSEWTQHSSFHNYDEMLKYLIIYGTLSAASILLSLVSNCVGQYCGARARKHLHDNMLLGLISCPVRFFETTSLGCIMNRFSTDLGVIDKKIATSIQRLLQFLLLCFSAVLVNSVVTPWFLIIAIPLCLVYYVVQKFYRSSSRELQRLDSMSRAPILSHFSETLNGLETIRAFAQQKRFMSVFFYKLDTHTNTFLIINSCNRWLGIALDYLGGIIVFVAMITSLATASLLPGLVTPALVGLAINYTLLVPIYLNWVVKFVADMEMYMGAVERVSQYAKATSEDYRIQGSVPKLWPQKGDIKFEGVSLRYDSNREPVITNLNLHIPAGQKVGICGRTGSGKSSLVMSLFNMVSISEGNIYIDGIDISTVPVKTLRSRLSIIPQDVIMFSGTIRENLDLRGEYSDGDLWSSLELAQIKESVSTQLGGLDGIVREGGGNLSAGQRQLLCLARAILHNASCLVMDEATSSLDPTTEKKLLQAANESFSTRTTFTIAHRLSSLLTCDRILVLESGRIVEDGSPSHLLNRSMGIFSTMLRAAEDNN